MKSSLEMKRSGIEQRWYFEREWERERVLQRKRTREKLSASLLIQNCPKHSFTLSRPLSFPFARPPPETVLLHHSTWFHTPRPNIKADMKRNEKHRIVFPQTSCVHCSYLCHALWWCKWTYISLAGCTLSFHQKTFQRTAVFLSLPLHLTGQSLCFSSGHLTCRLLPSGWYTWSLSTPRCAHRRVKTRTSSLTADACIHTIESNKHICGCLSYAPC